MQQIVECIPNFSEGRDAAALALLQESAASIPGAALLDVHIDADHNRSVLTLAGSPKAMAEAAFALAKTAVRCIDLTKHHGQHPRMGAVDVIPFVPIKNVTMSDCVDLAKQVGERIAKEFALPVFLYEEAAKNPERKNLADIRRGGFEGMAKKMAKQGWKPDFGSNIPHPTAGVVAVGARKPLIAFNINLDTSDIKIAKAVAKAVRGSSGGLRFCKALGMFLADKGIAQVSMNLVDYEQTPIYRVFEVVKTEAARYGVKITGSELVGLAPAKALIDCAEYFLRLENFDMHRHTLENKIDIVTKQCGHSPKQ